MLGGRDCSYKFWSGFLVSWILVFSVCIYSCFTFLILLLFASFCTVTLQCVCAGGITAWPHPTITFSKAIELWILKASSKIVLQGLLPASGCLIWRCIKAHHKQLKTGFYPKWWVVLAIDTLLSCFTIIYQSYCGFVWDLLKSSYNFLWKQTFNVLSVHSVPILLSIHSVPILNYYLHYFHLSCV